MHSYLTVKEAAEILGLSGSRVRELIANEQLPGEKRAGAWWLKRSDVEAFKKLPEGHAYAPKTLKKRRRGNG